jgi:hypothetical protein
MASHHGESAKASYVGPELSRRGWSCVHWNRSLAKETIAVQYQLVRNPAKIGTNQPLNRQIRAWAGKRKFP